MASVYYICFNKLPSRSAKQRDDIAFSIAIQNDLREVIYDPPDGSDVRLRIAWIAESSEEGNTFRHVQDAGTLIWTHSTQAYSVVHAKCPSDRGRTLRLAVYEEFDGQGWVYNLHNHAQICQKRSAVFIPIVSPPIAFDERDTGEKLLPCRLFDLGSSVIIRMQERGGFSLEGHLWDAALHLADWLINEGREYVDRASNVLELGAGTGLISVVASKLAERQKHSRTQVKMLATDLGAALELLHANASPSVKVEELDWELAESSALLQASHFDLVLVADCTYNPSSFSALCKTIAAALSKEKDARCLLSKKHRHVDEDTLWSTLQSHKLSYELIEGADARLEQDSLYTYTGWGIYLIRSTVSS